MRTELVLHRFSNCWILRCNAVIVVASLFTKQPWPGGTEGTFRSSCQAAACPLYTMEVLAKYDIQRRYLSKDNFSVPVLLCFGLALGNITGD